VDGEPMPSRGNEQEWLAAWHPADSHPIGVPHGAAGICVDSEDNLVLISHDGEHWDFQPDDQDPSATRISFRALEEAGIS
jgi:hypothetical protein